MADRLDELERKETTHQQYIRSLEERIKRLEDDKRKGNLIIDGIQEADNENLSCTVTELLRDLTVKFGLEQIDKVFRTGLKRDNNNRPRPILVKLRSAHLKGEIFKRVKNLRNNVKWRNVYLHDDLSLEEQHKRREMRCIAALAKSRGIRCQLKNGGLVIDDQRYTHSDMERLPYGLSMAEAKIVKVENGTAFQGHHAFMSNMFHVNIKYEGHTYSSAEHLYQTMCVEACNDNELVKEIKRTVDPYLARSLAKKVKKTKKWHESKLKVMEKIIRLKFDQNDAIRAKLQNTTGNLYEATTDKVFGTLTTQAIRSLRHSVLYH